jgi:hypothetical protein
MSKIEFDVYKTEAATADDYMKSFDTFEAAEEYANANECELIEECGGSWDTYKKCWSCGNWFSEYELNRGGTCERCEITARDHGF